MNITFIASESNPFIKTGGLADVVYSLADKYASLKHNVNIVIPFYTLLKNKLTMNVTYLGNFNLKMSWRNIDTKVCYVKYRGINFYFIENDYYFGRSNLYGEGDDGERFAYFSLASIELLKHFKIKSDIIHVHDWQVGMIPVVCKVNEHCYFKNSRFVLTIHNPAFQGNYETGFILDTYSLPYEIYENGSIRFKDGVSTLKAGIMYADKITTVSPTHREELLTSDGGYGLDGSLRCREYDFVGVVNGIDYDEFNPSKDEYIAATYNLTTFYKGKSINKEALLKKFGLPNKGQPLYGLVSRLTWQKGINLVIPTIRELVRRGAQFVILGSGEYALEQEFESLHKEYPDNVGIYIGYNNKLAHLIYAGSDFFLMPSLFEPCGLSQLISERYGTLPIVRLTGGLKDTVTVFGVNDELTANGFGFVDYNAYEFARTVHYSYDLYWILPIRKQLIKNAMKTDNSWDKSSKFYLGIYQELVNK